MGMYVFCLHKHRLSITSPLSGKARYRARPLADPADQRPDVVLGRVPASMAAERSGDEDAMQAVLREARSCAGVIGEDAAG